MTNGPERCAPGPSRGAVARSAALDQRVLDLDVLIDVLQQLLALLCLLGVATGLLEPALRLLEDREGRACRRCRARLLHLERLLEQRVTVEEVDHPGRGRRGRRSEERRVGQGRSAGG